MKVRVLVALALASCLASPSAAAQCGVRLHDADRAELVPRMVHGTAYLEHPTLGFRFLAPAFARVGDAAQEALSHRWRWEAAGEHVEVRITCDDRASEPGFVQAFATARARAGNTPAATIAERHEEGFSMVEQRAASGATIMTRHRPVSSRGRSFVLSVSASHRDTSTSLHTLASALPPTTLAGPDRSREDIRDTIRRSIVDFRICYERSDAIERDMSGRVTASFIVDQAGDVQNAAISASTLGHAQVEGCVRQTVRLLRFGARAEPGLIGVNYPFVFDHAP